MIACIASFAISLVNERTQGTFLRLRTAPFSRAHILGGKALACLLEIAVLPAIARIVFKVRLGSPPLMVMAVVCTSLCFVGIMMFVSILGRTGRAVAGAGWAIFVVMAMTGGGMIPLLFMPAWFRTVSRFSPVKWGISALEGAIWRGFSFQEMLFPCGILLGIGIALFLVGLILFRRLEQSIQQRIVNEYQVRNSPGEGFRRRFKCLLLSAAKFWRNFFVGSFPDVSLHQR